MTVERLFFFLIFMKIGITEKIETAFQDMIVNWTRVEEPLFSVTLAAKVNLLYIVCSGSASVSQNCAHYHIIKNP